MLSKLLKEDNRSVFCAKVFSLYLNGYGDRSVYFNGPIGTILHAVYLSRAARHRSFRAYKETVYLPLTDAQQRSSKFLCDSTEVINLGYRRRLAVRSIFDLGTPRFILEGVTAAIKIRNQLSVFSANKWVHVLAAGFQVAAGQRLAIACAGLGVKALVWGSDHCVVVRTAVVAVGTRTKHFFLPHGPCIGATNQVRDRRILDHVYALNYFQKAVMQKWDSSLSISVVAKMSPPPVSSINRFRNRPFVLFLNQLDLGLKRSDGFSSELTRFLNKIDLREVLGVVVKDQYQLDKFKALYNTAVNYIRFEEFALEQSPDRVNCVVFSSGVSVDLLLAGYELFLSPGNPLLEDEKARQLLKVAETPTWGPALPRRVSIDIDELEKNYA